MRICSRCGISKDISEFYLHKREKLGRAYMCKECSRSAYAEASAEAKSRVFEHYGMSCVCCGETHQAFLTIDHVSGGGNRQRAEMGISGGARFYRWLIGNNYPDGYQTLCFNCNCGRAINNGVCPHVEFGNAEQGLS
jgi:alpha-tubulin suppressor-like RCC1 family protein